MAIRKYKRNYAKARARTKSREAYRSLMKKPKESIAKIASNFIGKSTYMSALEKGKRVKRRTLRNKSKNRPIRSRSRSRKTRRY